MGTWSTGSFGNDTAGDWIIDLAENPTLDFINETLQNGLKILDDSDTNMQAVAAAEVICILKGHGPNGYEKDADGVNHNLDPVMEKLSTEHVPEALITLAIETINLIGSESELKELWDGDSEWDAEIADLKERLQR